MLTADNLHLWRGERHVLKGVGFELAAGELLHVSGPNGTGKTTLLRVVAGLALPEQGEVRWGGHPTRAIGSEFCERLGYVAHDAGLKGDLTARENLAFAVRLRHAIADTDIDAALAALDVAYCADVPARALSAGQRRRIALARLVLSQALLWILDEPLTNLDIAGVALVLELIARHLESGGLAMVATHGDMAIRGGAVRRLELA
jgi:heme exporter protein A